MKMYKALQYSDEIKEVEIIRKTKSTVWVMSEWGREKRESITQYFDTFDEAKLCIVNRCREKVDLYNKELRHAENAYNKSLLITKP